MKDKIVFFIIGLLVGAIITTSCFLIYNKCLKNKDNEFMPFIQDNDVNMEKPPEKPDDNNNYNTPKDGENI